MKRNKLHTGKQDYARAVLEARKNLTPCYTPVPVHQEAEGGCGVTGFACTLPVSGKNIYEPSIQMRNRGNGKGGGIAVSGMVPEELGVSRKVLDEDYILQIALLDNKARAEVEKTCIAPFFDIDQGGLIPTVDDFREVDLLEIKPQPILFLLLFLVFFGVLCVISLKRQLVESGLMFLEH